VTLREPSATFHGASVARFRRVVSRQSRPEHWAWAVGSSAARMATPRSRTRSSTILHSARWVRLGRKRLFFNTRTPVRFLHWIWRQERCDFPKLLAECVVLTTAPVRRE